jgi:small subunit ribosomal protein S12
MQVFIMKPKKPNLARHKVTHVRLMSGKVPQAYIHGKRHSLQEHSIMLIRGGRAQDLPSIQRAAIDTSCSSLLLTECLVSYSYKLAPGASDLRGVMNRVTSRSWYGGKHPI